MKIQDVARKANVGVGTVSRVINNNGYVSEKTREKVERAIRELQYTPNELARNLYHNKTNTVAVIVPDISNPFYASLVNEIEMNLRRKGYKTMLCNTVGEQTNEELYLSMLQRNMVDGILTASHSLDSKKYAGITGPVVSFDTAPLSDRIPVITVDHREGGRMAARLLLESGCKHIVQFHDNMFDKFPFFERHQEFEKTVREAGAEYVSYIMERDCFTEDFYGRIVDNWFDKYPQTDGVFGTDMLAAFCLKKALSKGMHVPDDLKIVSYDGTLLANMVYPTLTCIRQPVPEIAKAGVEQLMKIIKDGKADRKVIKLPVTIERGMTTMTER
nr:LacI family DNA-binding transcriptional regulator [uncultured Mediterraneibacter sp.]